MAMAVDTSRSCHLVLPFLLIHHLEKHVTICNNSHTHIFIPSILHHHLHHFPQESRFPLDFTINLAKLGFRTTPFTPLQTPNLPTMASPTPISPLPLFFSMFFTIYLTAHFILFRHWTPKLRPEAASCSISLAHGTPAVLLACRAIISTNTHGFASPNTDSQNSVLEYSIAYFLMDLCHYLIFNPSDVLFIGHHLATLFVFVTCRYLVVHGAYGILILLILAEVTSFFQNVWTLASVLKVESKVAAQVFDVLSPPFYALYSVVRGLFGPLFVYRMVGFYLSGAADDVIPRWVWISWICIIVAAISVSILWISNRWIELYRERLAVVEKEKKVR